MIAKEKVFLHFLEGADKYFVIPVYQRNYDWKIEQCKQLYDDLVEVVRSEFRSHFIGSIVSIYHHSSDDREYLIIDGQQRITTLTLLLIAIYNLIEYGELSATFNHIQIKEEYIINKYSQKKNKIRLKPIKYDQEALRSIIEGNYNLYITSNVVKNYNYFMDRIKSQEISINELYLAIKKLIIVEIELRNGEDDPQLIFESLNSTGLDLSEADKVRNFILMRESPERQEEFYNKYWNIIEKNTNYSVSEFIRHYLTIKQRIIPNKSKIYTSFKNYVLQSRTPIEHVLIDLLKYSKYYSNLIGTNSTHVKVSKALHNIRKLDVDTSYPYLLEIFDEFSEKENGEKVILEVIKIIESFIFRRLICGVPTNALNKIFMILGKEIQKYEESKDDYIEVLKFVLLNKKKAQRFPSDEEFIENFRIKDVYNMTSKNKLYLLEQLENYENVELVNLEDQFNKSLITVEHIMPQNLSPRWKNALGSQYQKIHQKYLHTIGNITLTGYNSRMSNKTFPEKRDMAKGFKESRLFLNKFLAELNEWNEKTLLKRAEFLGKRAIKIWPFVTTEFLPIKDESKTISLADEEYEFTGKKIDSFIFLDTEYRASSWRDFADKVFQLLNDLDAQKFQTLTSDSPIKTKILNSSKGLKTPLKIADNMYLESNLSTESIVQLVCQVLLYFGLELDEVEIVLK